MKISGFLFGLVLPVFALSTHAYSASYTIIDPPNSTYTAVTGVNNNGEIIGYFAAAGVYQGFLRTPDGTYTTLEFSTEADPYAINDKGVIAGDYLRKGILAGFIRRLNGHMETFTLGRNVEVYVTGIDQNGDVAGYDSNVHKVSGTGFIRAPDGTVTSVLPPGAKDVQTGGMNRSGALSGSFQDKRGYHGFIRAVDGTFTTIDYPGSEDTFAQSINDDGTVAGFYLNNGDVTKRGFTRDASGVFASFDTNGISPDSSVEWVTVNTKGEVAGYFYYSDEAFHAFLRTAGGKVKAINPPEQASVPESEAVGITKDGAIAGTFLDSNYITHGFVRTP